MKKIRKVLFFHMGDSDSTKIEKLLEEKSLVKNFLLITIFSHDASEPTIQTGCSEYKGIGQILSFLT